MGRKKKVDGSWKEWSEYQDGKRDPVLFAHQVLGLELHQGQQQWIYESLRSKKNVLVPSNQWGKTTALAVKHIWMQFYKIGIPDDLLDLVSYETLDISPQLRQAKALYGYVLQILQGQMWWYDAEGRVHVNDRIKIRDFLVKPLNVPATNQMSNTPIQFANGGKLYAAPTGSDLGAGLAGSQFPYISYDECSLSYNLEDELPARIMSRLIKYNGTIDLVGTPDDISPSFLYYKRIAKKGLVKEDGWSTFIGKLDDNTFIPQKNRDEIKKTLFTTDPEKYRQVVFGEFIENSGHVFQPTLIKKMWKDNWKSRELERGSVRCSNPELGHSYVIGVDWAIAGDYTVMVVLDYTDQEEWKIAHFYRIKGSDKEPQQQYIDLLNLKREYAADVCMDTNGLGGKLIESEFKSESGFFGFNFGPGKKAGFIGTLQKYIHWNNEGKIRSPIIQTLEDELLMYRMNDTQLKQDTVMALGLAVWFIDRQEALPEAIDYYNKC